MGLSEIEINSMHGHGRATETTVDGVPMKGLTRVSLDFDVNDVNRVKLEANVKAHVALLGEVESSYHAVIVVRGVVDGLTTEYRATGQTAKEAMLLAVDLMP